MHRRLETGLVLVAAGGEGDPAWAEPAGAVTLEANDHYPGRRGQGTSVAFGLRTGPATLLSLSPEPEGWVLAWAPAKIIETRYGDMRGPNGMFRFASGPSARPSRAGSCRVPRTTTPWRPASSTSRCPCWRPPSASATSACRRVPPPGPTTASR